MNRTQFVHHLEGWVRSYRTTLEQMFGPCDSRFVFGTVRLTTNKDDKPQTYSPNQFHRGGNCTVDVHISRCPWENLFPDQSVWQVAHESVHLLDPGKLGTNFLEEGLATWFQDEPRFHNKDVQCYIPKAIGKHSVLYVEARELVRHAIPHRLCSAIKELRASGVRIPDIKADVLGPHLPHVSDATIKQLCVPFE